MRPARVPGTEGEAEDERRRPPEPAPEAAEEERERTDEPAPLDSGTVQSLKAADPRSRAQYLLRLQRLHGNQAVQRVIRALQTTDAGRDARIQSIGDRAEEPAPSGKLDRALLYREAIEAELDTAPLAAKSERELVQDNVNTIGQIFTNYQAALHQFEAAAGDGLAESVPLDLAKEVLREGARDVFEPVLAEVSATVAGLGDRTAEALGEVDDLKDQEPREPGASAPAHAIKGLLVAERRRLAAAHTRIVKGQVGFMAMAEERAVRDGGGDYRSVLAACAESLNEMESGSHSAEAMFKKLMERWKDAVEGRVKVSVVLDADWKVVRAHITAPEGSKLASQLLEQGSGWFDLRDLHLPRHVTWEPAELALCEAVLDGRGAVVHTARNEKGGAHFDDFVHRLRREGLPRTRVLTGD
jgi:hypothetical protein